MSSLEILGLKFDSTWTKEDTIENNAGCEKTIGLIFEKYNVDDNKDNLSEKELKAFYESVSSSSEGLLNPEEKERIEKLWTSIKKIHDEEVELEKQIGELEQMARDNYAMINSAEISEEKKELIKKDKDLRKQIDKLYKELDKKNDEKDKEVAKNLYLMEVKLETDISDTNLEYNSKKYLQQRNLMNPFYKAWMEAGKKMDAAENSAERNIWYQEWRRLEKFVGKWAPNNGESYSAQSGISITTELKTNADDNIIYSASVNANQNLGKHSLNENVSYSRQDKENSSSDNISASLSDNITLGENTNVSISENYSNYMESSEEGKSSNSNLTSEISANHQFGKKKNFEVSANYQNMLQFTKSNGVSSTPTISNNFGTNFNYKLKDFSFGTGYSFNNTKSDNYSLTQHTIPVTARYNHHKGHNNFGANVGYSKDWSNESNIDNYSAGFNYSFNNENLSFSTSASAAFGHSNKDENHSQRYMAQAQISDNKYGESFLISYSKYKSAYCDTTDVFGQINVPASETVNWYLKGGYDTDMGGYGMLGITWNIPTHKKHK